MGGRKLAMRFDCSAWGMRFKCNVLHIDLIGRERAAGRCIELLGDGHLGRPVHRATKRGNILECEAKAKEPLIIDITEPHPHALLRRVVFRQNEPPHQTRSCHLLQMTDSFKMSFSD